MDFSFFWCATFNPNSTSTQSYDQLKGTCIFLPYSAHRLDRDIREAGRACNSESGRLTRILGVGLIKFMRHKERDVVEAVVLI